MVGEVAVSAMLMRMDNTGRTLDREDIRRIESRLGVTLPDDYVRFLARLQRWKAVPDAFPLCGLDKNPTGTLQTFFGIDRDEETSDLLWNYQTMKGRLPEDLLPIARNGSGDLICLAIKGVRSGRIMLWNYYGETNPPSTKNLYPVSPTFSALLDTLHED